MLTAVDDDDDDDEEEEEEEEEDEEEDEEESEEEPVDIDDSLNFSIKSFTSASCLCTHCSILSRDLFLSISSR